MTETRVAIIGAGPIGLELAAALKRSGIAYLQFDAGQIGQTITQFAPQTKFFSSTDRISISGIPLQSVDQSKATREEYLMYLRTVALQLDLRVRTYEPVVAIDRRSDPGAFKLFTRANGAEYVYRCNKLVIATGGTAFPRKLGAPGEDLPHVTHELGDVHQYFRQRLVVVGGKNSAIEAALRCHNAGANVTIVYRRSQLSPQSVKYWLLPEMDTLLKSGKIKSHFGSIVQQITPEAVHLLRCNAELEPISTDSATVAADRVLLMVGYTADMRLCKMAGVRLNGPQQVPTFDPITMESNVPGLYLAGTVTGGTQDRYTVFIENGHIHTDRIVAALSHTKPPADPQPYVRPES